MKKFLRVLPTIVVNARVLMAPAMIFPIGAVRQHVAASRSPTLAWC